MKPWHLPVVGDSKKPRAPRRLTAIPINDGGWSAEDVIKDVTTNIRFGALRLSQTLRNSLSNLSIARCVLVEDGYFDLDSRSEDAVTIERQFRFERPITLRFHFFATEISAEQFLSWIETGKPDAAGQDSYLGYLIVRGRRNFASVGRSLLRPTTTDERVAEPDTIESRVRTLADELVDLYGVELLARGVPFMQQDGALTSCSHVTAWMAHYTAVLRGLVPRVPIADILPPHRSPDNGREYPTRGLEDHQILRALGHGGIAPTVVYLIDQDQARPPEWYDRPAIHISGGDCHPWHRENITAIIARYLNSGFPLILAKGDHTVLLCGYLRRSEMVPDRSTQQQVKSIVDSDTAVDALIYHDESDGPYRIALVSRMFADISQQDALIVPLPPGLALSGSDAELVGARQFVTQVQALLNDRREEAEGRTGGVRAVQQSEETLRAIHDCRYAVRTYASFNSNFKASIRERCPIPEVVRTVAMARLPRFVWVVEVIDRAKRNQGHPVIGQVIVDATATSEADARVLIVHVPGFVESLDLVTGLPDGYFCAVAGFDSGRWAQGGANPWTYGSLPTKVSLR